MYIDRSHSESAKDKSSYSEKRSGGGQQEPQETEELGWQQADGCGRGRGR